MVELSKFFFVSHSNEIIKWSMIGLILVAFIYLLILSLIIRDIKYPKDHPYLFTLETLLFSFGAAGAVFIMAHGRDKISIKTLWEFLALSLKFGVFHILLQFSGFYDYVFDYNRRSLLEEVKKKLI